MVYSPEKQNMVNNPSFSFGGKLNHDKPNQSLASGACSLIVSEKLHHDKPNNQNPAPGACIREK